MISYGKYKEQFAERVELCKTHSDLSAHYTSHIGSYEPITHFSDPSLVFEMPTYPLEVEQRVLNLFMIKLMLDIEPNPHLVMKS